MNLKEFTDWALKQGTVGNPTEEESYKGECVSLVQQYLSKVHGIPFKARGNAKDWINTDIEGFTKITPENYIQDGDIVVWNTGKYGHIAIISAGDRILEQNRRNDDKITLSEWRGGYQIIHRPNEIYLGEEQEVFNVRVNKEKAVVRTEPNTGSDRVTQPSGRNYLAKGVVFNAVDLVEGEDPYMSGNNKWYKSEKGNYVWSGGLTRI